LEGLGDKILPFLKPVSGLLLLLLLLMPFISVAEECGAGQRSQTFGTGDADGKGEGHFNCTGWLPRVNSICSFNFNL
jgi:hypothetical protein